MKALKLSLLFTTLVSVPVFAQSTFTLGYAFSKVEDVNLNGFNAQFRYEWNAPMSFLVSASRLNGDKKYSDGSVAVKYTSLLAGPAYRFNDLVSIYGLTGFTKTTAEENDVGYYYKDIQSAFAYGVGVQLNAAQNLVVHVGYEGSKIVEAKANGLNVGIGYRF